jgi:hypothetical protein
MPHAQVLPSCCARLCHAPACHSRTTTTATGCLLQPMTSTQALLHLLCSSALCTQPITDTRMCHADALSRGKHLASSPSSWRRGGASNKRQPRSKDAGGSRKARDDDSEDEGSEDQATEQQTSSTPSTASDERLHSSHQQSPGMARAEVDSPHLRQQQHPPHLQHLQHPDYPEHPLHLHHPQHPQHGQDPHPHPYPHHLQHLQHPQHVHRTTHPLQPPHPHLHPQPPLLDDFTLHNMELGRRRAAEAVTAILMAGPGASVQLSSFLNTITQLAGSAEMRGQAASIITSFQAQRMPMADLAAAGAAAGGGGMQGRPPAAAFPGYGSARGPGPLSNGHLAPEEAHADAPVPSPRPGPGMLQPKPMEGPGVWQPPPQQQHPAQQLGGPQPQQQPWQLLHALLSRAPPHALPPAQQREPEAEDKEDSLPSMGSQQMALWGQGAGQCRQAPEQEGPVAGGPAGGQHRGPLPDGWGPHLRSNGVAKAGQEPQDQPARSSNGHQALPQRHAPEPGSWDAARPWPVPKEEVMGAGAGGRREQEGAAADHAAAAGKGYARPPPGWEEGRAAGGYDPRGGPPPGAAPRASYPQAERYPQEAYTGRAGFQPGPTAPYHPDYTPYYLPNAERPGMARTPPEPPAPYMEAGQGYRHGMAPHHAAAQGPPGPYPEAWHRAPPGWQQGAQQGPPDAGWHGGMAGPGVRPGGPEQGGQGGDLEQQPAKRRQLEQTGYRRPTPLA